MKERKEFTGERLVLGVGLDIEHEHFHRYVWATEFCRDKKVLDVASGDGYGTYILSQRAKTVCGCEINEEAVRSAQKNYHAENLSYHAASCTQTPFPDDLFDVVVSFETIEHIQDYELFVKEVRRVLKPGGIFICSTPEIHEFNELSQVENNEFHIHEFEKKEFVELLQRQFPQISLVGQSFAASSVMASLDPANTPEFHHYHVQNGQVTKSDHGLVLPTFLIALCSDVELPSLPGSYFSSRESKTLVSELLINKFEQYHEIERLKKIESETKQELETAQNTIEWYQNSFSWKVTRPIRSFTSRHKKTAAFLRRLVIPGENR